jgi:hypothetical protein
MSTSFENDPGGDIVNVPVPRKHLRTVYSALATAMAADDAATAVAPAAVREPPEGRPPWEMLDKPEGEAVYVQDQGWWTPDMIRRLHERLTYPGVRALITMMAEQAPRELTLAEVEAATTTKVVQLRAELGALTKLVKKVFNERLWPFTVRWGSGGVANYWMDETIARWWLRWAAEEPGSSN